MNLKLLLTMSSIALSLQAEAKSLKIHEWGTFTSFQDSFGASIDGIHRGDQPLPEFVYLRNPHQAEPSHDASGCLRMTYACDFDPYGRLKGVAGLGVNQRMETPVIYFHTDEAQAVSVQVDFPQGLVTEWYPSAASFAPAINQVNAIAGGSMKWNVQVHTDRLELPPVAADSVWQPSREVEANDISVGRENERLIFYRGVGKFVTPFTVRAEAHDFLIENSSTMPEYAAGRVPAVLYVRTDGVRGVVRQIGSIQAPGYKIAQYADTSEQPMIPLAEYMDQAMKLLVQALNQSGLNHDESVAMANTWKTAYLTTPGERFLYILPQAWTEVLLPMSLNPVPDELVRTLVGRVEVMNQDALKDLFAQIEAHAIANTPITLVNKDLGGFSEQKLLLLETHAAGVFKERLGSVLGQPVEEARVADEQSVFRDYVQSLIYLIRY